MIYVCVICMVKRPPLSPMEAEYRKLLEAVVSPVINTDELKTFQWLLCTNCKPLLQAVHNFQQTALAGVNNLKHLLRKLKTAQIEGRKLKVVTIKREPNVSTAAPKQFITAEAPINVDSLTEELVLKFEPESELQPEFEPELEPHCDSDSTMSCDSNTDAQSNEKATTSTKQVQVIPKMIEGRKLKVVTIKIEPNVSTAAPKQFITAEAPINVDPLTEELVLKFEPESELQPEFEPELEPHCDSDSTMSCDSNTDAQSNEKATTSTKQVQVIPKMGATAGIEGTFEVFTHKPQPTLKAAPYLSSIRWKDGVREGSKIIKRKKPSRVSCPHCGKFVLDTNLRTHVTGVHGQWARCKCDICGKLFRNPMSLNSHKKSHNKNTTIDDICPELYCQECAKPFPNRCLYRAHLRTLKHMSRDQYQFECETCNRKFLDERRRQLHINIVHLGLRKHKCDQCDKTYGNAASLRKHVAVFHEKRVNPPKHVCHLCGKSFTVSKSLNEHLLTHEGLRPHQCPLCPATFTYKASLFTHNKLKHLKIKGNWKKKKKVAEKEGIREVKKTDSND